MTICFTEGILQAYLDEELATEEAAGALAHLAECPECARRLAAAERERLQVWNALIDEMPALVPTARLRTGIGARISRTRSPILAPFVHSTREWRIVLAAVMLIVLSVMIWTWLRPAAPEQRVALPHTDNQKPREQDVPKVIAGTPNEIDEDRQSGRKKVRRNSHTSAAPAAMPSVAVDPDESIADLYDGSYLFDAETTRHLEKAQVLLRSFNNAPSGTGRRFAYEKRQSRGLVYANILLRREAEAEENSPASSLLGSLEPFLLDIANLPEKPSSGELASVRQRIRNSDIVAALQVYISSMD
jgi:putative zinc finger protein